MAWLLNLEQAGLEPEIIVIEEIPPGGDWVEAEQFWIAYFRGLGADLCNHTAGGEGVPGYKQPPEMIAKRIKRGPENHRYGKTMPEKTKEALRVGGIKFRSDPVKVAAANAKRKDALGTPENRQRQSELSKQRLSDPVYKANVMGKWAEASRRPESRKRVGEQSTALWATKRDEIIAAQNAGKGDEWKRKQSEAKLAIWADPQNRERLVKAAAKKLTAPDVENIRSLLRAGGMSQSAIAKQYGVVQAIISRIKTGRRKS